MEEKINCLENEFFVHMSVYLSLMGWSGIYMDDHDNFLNWMMTLNSMFPSLMMTLNSMFPCLMMTLNIMFTCWIFFHYHKPINKG